MLSCNFNYLTKAAIVGLATTLLQGRPIPNPLNSGNEASTLDITMAPRITMPNPRGQRQYGFNTPKLMDTDKSFRFFSGIRTEILPPNSKVIVLGIVGPSIAVELGIEKNMNGEEISYFSYHELNKNEKEITAIVIPSAASIARPIAKSPLTNEKRKMISLSKRTPLDAKSELPIKIKNVETIEGNEFNAANGYEYIQHVIKRNPILKNQSTTVYSAKKKIKIEPMKITEFSLLVKFPSDDMIKNQKCQLAPIFRGTEQLDRDDNDERDEESMAFVDIDCQSLNNLKALVRIDKFRLISKDKYPVEMIIEENRTRPIANATVWPIRMATIPSSTINFP